MDVYRPSTFFCSLVKTAMNPGSIKKLRLLFLLCSGWAVLLVIYLFLKNEMLTMKQPYGDADNMKYILLYNHNPDILSLHLFDKCKNPCAFKTDTSKLDKSDVVFFIGQTLSNEPPEKRQGQVWIFYSAEPPELSGLKTIRSAKWKNKFNWTMTVRRDSDFYYPYCSFEKLNNSKNSNRPFNVSTWPNRDRQLIWFVSNCKTQSNRKAYMDLLSKEIPVDIIGKCGNKSHKCFHKNNHVGCLEFASNHYKFYVAFENAFCRDYITEKSCDLYLYGTDIVPIVRGFKGIYDISLPKGSFINTDDFDTPTDLAKQLNKIGTDVKSYESYFKWREQYKAISGYDSGACSICDRLHTENWKTKYNRLYDDLGEWIEGNRRLNPICVPPNDIRTPLPK